MATLAVAKAHLTAEFNKARADLATRQAVVLPEIRDRLVIGSETAQQPHHLDIASGNSDKAVAGLELDAFMPLMAFPFR
jgi:hypothetical protein